MKGRGLTRRPGSFSTVSFFVRFRRIRDKYALTQAGKAANRMTFAELGEDEFQVEAQAQRVVKQKGQVRLPSLP